MGFVPIYVLTYFPPILERLLRDLCEDDVCICPILFDRLKTPYFNSVNYGWVILGIHTKDQTVCCMITPYIR